MQKNKKLLVDIGNSNTVIAQYHNKQIKKVENIPTNKLKEQLAKLSLSEYKEVLVSSVVPQLDAIVNQFKNVFFVNYQNIPFINIKQKKPQEAGADRLVNAVAAHYLYKENVLIIDSGTAITFCYVEKNGCYQGGAIFPGMGIASKALELYTAKIPLIRVEPITGILGKSTKEAVEIGLYQGYICLINGMIDLYKEMDPNLIVVGAGNGLAVIKNKIAIDYMEPDLILKGLGIIADQKEGK
jgi:type III pantothenate kinase